MKFCFRKILIAECFSSIKVKTKIENSSIKVLEMQKVRRKSSKLHVFLKILHHFISMTTRDTGEQLLGTQSLISLLSNCELNTLALW